MKRRLGQSRQHRLEDFVAGGLLEEGSEERPKGATDEGELVLVGVKAGPEVIGGEERLEEGGRQRLRRLSCEKTSAKMIQISMSTRE
jgi:hypothetical protein